MDTKETLYIVPNHKEYPRVPTQASREPSLSTPHVCVIVGTRPEAVKLEVPDPGYAFTITKTSQVDGDLHWTAY